jgi:hypothetical protein
MVASLTPHCDVAPIGVGDASHKSFIGNDLVVTQTAQRVLKKACDIDAKILDNVNNVK